MMKLPLLLILLPLFGCAGWKPYADVAVGVPINSQTHYLLQTDRSWQCSRGPQAHVEVGLEAPNHLYIGLNHQSWWFCGSLNDTPEVYSNQIVIGGRWGGQ